MKESGTSKRTKKNATCKKNKQQYYRSQSYSIFRTRRATRTNNKQNRKNKNVDQIVIKGNKDKHNIHSKTLKQKTHKRHL